MQIQEKNHIVILNSSLNKSYNKSKIDGVLENVDLYFLNCIYKIINNNKLNLTSESLNKLILFYNKLLMYNKNLCNLQFITQYKINNINNFTQANSSDCNETNSFGKIYYWQETFENDNIEIVNLINLDYLNNKLNDSYESFVIGKNINYNIIGKLCFFMLNSQSPDNFIIVDALGNNVTHAFDKYYNTLLQGNLYISQNIYAHGDLFFKIKK